MKPHIHILPVLLTGLLLTGTAAEAQPAHAKGKYKAVKVEKRGGPPPWAPAHGYRRQHQHYRDYGLATVPIDISSGRCNREVMGQVLGAAIGGLAGAEIAGNDDTGRLIGVAAGTFVGTLLGGEIGRSMDRADALCIDQALEHAPDGTTIRWNDGDNQYAVTPRETIRNEDGRYCRQYSTDAGIQGQRQPLYGMACRRPDGSWELVN